MKNNTDIISVIFAVWNKIYLLTQKQVEFCFASSVTLFYKIYLQIVIKVTVELSEILALEKGNSTYMACTTILISCHQDFSA